MKTINVIFVLYTVMKKMLRDTNTVRWL